MRRFPILLASLAAACLISVCNGQPGPAITSLQPSSTAAGSPAFTLTVNGSGLLQCIDGSSCLAINWQPVGGASVALPPTSINPNGVQVTANVPANLVASPGLVNVSVTAQNGTGSSTSNALQFTIVGPVITSINPTFTVAGTPGLTLTINGSGFNPVCPNLCTFVQWQQGNNPLVTLTPATVSGTQITVNIPAALLTTPGPVAIAVMAGGVTSNTAVFTITTPQPVITSISPSTVTAGGPSFTLTVNGTGFFSGSVVNLNGTPLATTFVSNVQLTATVPASAIASPGSASITVVNPGVPASNAATLTIGFPVPVITSISPNQVTAGGPQFTLTVNGTAFFATSVVQLNGSSLATNFVNGQQLTATVPASAIASPGSASITVVNPGVPASNAATLTINTVGVTIANLTPNPVIAGGPAFTLTINGSGFLQMYSTVRFNGSTIPSTVVNGQQITVAIPANLIATPGTAAITVVNFGETLSNVVLLVINGPQIASIAPGVTFINSPAFTLTVAGANFLPGSFIAVNGTPLVTAFVSSSQLSAAITANYFSVPGSATVTVQNSPTAISPPVSLRILATPLTLTQIQPSFATVGGSAFTLNVFGTGFVDQGSSVAFLTSGSVVNWNGSPLPTTFLSTTQLSAPVPASLIAQIGTATVTVTNPDQTQSNPLTFTINPKPPIILSLSPPSAVAGSPAFTLTVTGTGFLNGANVVWNNAVLPTTFVSATQVTAAVSANLIANPGSANVSVVDQGLAPSNTLPFTITVPTAPVITSLAPSTTAPGGGDLALQVVGSGFVSGSVVQWNGAPLATTFADASHLTATVPATLTAIAGSAAVTVVNPNNLVSNAVTFTIRALPVITSLNPSSAIAGGPAFTLTVNGSGFVQPSSVLWNGVSLATTFVSSTQFQAAVTADLIAKVGTATVTVAVQDGPVSNGLPFQITALPPVITSLSPASTNAAGSNFTLTVDGSGFSSASVVRWSGTALNTTFVSATRLTAAVPGTLIANPGSSSITVMNADGAISNAATFSIALPPPPTVNFAGPATIGPLQQPKLDFSIGNSYPFPIAGRVDLTFQPDAVIPADDATIQFAAGGRTFSFTIAPNTTAVPDMLVQTGTVAGTITLHPTLTTAGTTLPVSDVTIKIARAAPFIRSVQLNRTSTGIEVVIVGFATPREVSQAAFHFNGAGTDVTVPVSTVFTTYYQSAASAQFGSQFTYTQPFTGDASAVTTVVVTLTNSVGSSAPVTSN